MVSLDNIVGVLDGVAGQQATAANAKDPTRLADAARQFEALLLGQILKTVQSSSSEGWLGTGEDQSAGSMMELGGEQFAQALATQGGLGLARMIVASMPEPAVTAASRD
jgi:Rod binding domain-containing protein